MLLYSLPFVIVCIFLMSLFLNKMLKTELKNHFLQAIIQSQQTQNENLNQGLLRIQDSLRENIRESDRQIKDTLERSQAALSVQFDKLNQTKDQR